MAVTVYGEMTPNPATMKFVADKMLIDNGESVEFFSKDKAVGHSSLAEVLFDFPFVDRIFIASNFVAVTKTEALQWGYVKDELRNFIQDWLRDNDVVVQKIPEFQEVEVSEGGVESIPEEPVFTSDTDRAIFELLEEYVKPAVEGDGGAIFFKSFDEVTGTVTVILKGACSGCPSASATLKMGVESLLKQHVPEVRSVIALED